ncbi:MAG: hypothetical protein KDC07_03720 [Chitinophagaceae bacterium]|nr:hypothetical protein [Chitinophagaceae bacterium]MCB9047380.1 hypothetical protein [Chitinophagales bacterium]
MFKKISIFIVVALLVYSCSKKAPFDTVTEDDLATHYCNDPLAINYNHGFPGTPDNSVCVYPTEVFTGTYSLTDSIYNGEYELDTILYYTIGFKANSLTELRMYGFCPSGDSVRLTADRYYKALVDSTLSLPDSNMVEGHVFCRAVDTIKGTINKYIGDSTMLRINLTIASDTGVNYHIGTGVKK